MQLFVWPSMTLWGWHYIMDFVDVLVRGQPLMMPLMMLLMIIMMHQPHPYQPWRLNRCNAFTQSSICAAIFISPGGARALDGRTLSIHPAMAMAPWRMGTLPSLPIGSLFLAARTILHVYLL